MDLSLTSLSLYQIGLQACACKFRLLLYYDNVKFVTRVFTDDFFQFSILVMLSEVRRTWFMVNFIIDVIRIRTLLLK
ncbi:hypothetical protein RJT34_25961 [Clitoria ternatea]|uniref:Uncharacterized protein n=1 Tax=Clitoria ternatea TaxID=43366 RepID=A0AAN9F8Q3_CLITE